MKIALSIFLTWATCFSAEAQQASSEAVTQREAHQQMSAAWKAVQPHLFTPKSVDTPTAAPVMVSGTILTFEPVITMRSDEGVVIHLTKLQKADREELAAFRSPPSRVTVEGPILSMDTDKKIIVIRAVSAFFSP